MSTKKAARGSRKRNVWAIFYQGHITLPLFLSKREAIDDLRSRPGRYYTNRKDYELVRYEAVELLHRKARP
jgi:hypothetical protein